MPRYRRINIDGCSLFETETRTAAADLLPGTAVTIVNDQFVQATTASGRLYVVDIGHHSGLKITEANPAGDSVVGNYLQDGREFAVLVDAGTFTKDLPLTVTAGGKFVEATEGATVVAYCQDEVTTTETDFIRVRVRAGVAAGTGA